jgi:hypothetical protein
MPEAVKETLDYNAIPGPGPGGFSLPTARALGRRHEPETVGLARGNEPPVAEIGDARVLGVEDDRRWKV